MPNTPTPTPEQIILGWKAPVHANHSRSKRWFISAGTVILVIAAYGILTGAWTVALVALLCGAMYVFVHDHTFPDAAAAITDKGVHVDNAYMSWENAEGFWLMLAPGYTELHVVRKDHKPDLIVQTGSADAQAIRQLLQNYLPELADKKERFLDMLIRICKL